MQGLQHTRVHPFHPSLRMGGIQATDHGIYVSTRPAGDVAPVTPEQAMSATHMQIALLSLLAGVGIGYVLFKRGV